MPINAIGQLNAQLAALAAQNDGRLVDINEAIARYQETKNANTATVLGNTVGNTVNGITTLDQTIDPEAGQSTAGQLVSITDESGLTPEFEEITDTALGGDNDGEEVSTVVLGTDLTGITPPKEPINIVALGGAAVDQIVSAIGESTDRKVELIESIAATATATSAAGVPDTFNDQILAMKQKILYPFADADTLDYFNTSLLYGEQWSQTTDQSGTGAHGNRLPKSENFTLSYLLKILPASKLDSRMSGRFHIINNMPGLQSWNGQWFRVWVSEFPLSDPITGANGVPLDRKSSNPNPMSWSWTHDTYYGQRDDDGNLDLSRTDIKDGYIWMIPQDMGNLYLNFALIGPPWKGWSYTPGDPSAGAVGEKEIDVIDYTFGFSASNRYQVSWRQPTLINAPSTQGMDSATRAVLTDVSAMEEFAGADAYNEAEASGLALAGALTSTVGAVVGGLTDVVTGNDGGLGGLGGLIDDVVDTIDDFVEGIATDIDTGFGAAQDLFEDLTGTATDALTSLLPGIGLAKETVSSVVSLITESQIFALRGDTAGADLNLSKAAKSLLKEDTSFSPKMREAIAEAEGNSISALADDIDKKAAAKGVSATERQRAKTQVTSTESALKKLDASIAGQIVDKVGDFYTEDADLAELVQRYTGATTESFAYVDSREELEYEFIDMSRNVSEVILHATDTYTNANIGSEEIHLRHNDAGHDGIQYHYVIRRDGRLQRGMPIAETSDASAINGHKANCIDVALVGGVNVPTEADAPDQHLSASSYTQAQMKTLEQLLLAFYQVVPGGQVLGHNDIDIESPDPYFDVPSYVENLFGKKSVYENPLVDPSVSLSDLVNKEPVS